MADPWATINCAPTDGTEILMFCPGLCSSQRCLDGEIIIGRWEGDRLHPGWYSDSSSSMEGYESTGDYIVHDPVFPTHWMPLPATPISKGE